MTYAEFGKPRAARAALAVALWLAGCAAHDSALPARDDGGARDAGGASQPGTPSGGSDAAPPSGGGGATSSGGSGPRVHVYEGAGRSGSAAQGGATGGIGGDAEGGAWEEKAGSHSGTGTGGIATGGVSTGGSAGSVSVELAAKKPSTSSSQQAGNEQTKGNDSDSGTRWCASDGTFPQWWRVDLGATHALANFSVSFQHADREYTYEIETSSDDAVYVKQVGASGTTAVHTGSFPPGVSARYVRIKITKAAPGVYESGTYPTWACFFELSIKGT